MNRNTESRFALTPSINIGRSTFHRNSGVKTSFQAGRLIPFYLDEVLPGDSFKVKTSKVIRMPMFQTAPMDNLYLDTYYFFVPNRLVWSHFKNFMGEAGDSAWIPETEYTIPQVTSPENGWNVGSLADYFGVPTGIDDLSINALPFRAYAKIVDDWFRSTVLDDPVNIPVDESTVAGSNGTDYVTDLVKGGMPFIANKYFDLFTGCLPAPQRGPDVLLPIGDFETDASLTANAPVFGNDYALGVQFRGSSVGVHTGSLSGRVQTNLAIDDVTGKTIGVIGDVTQATGTIGVQTKTQLGEHPEYSGLYAELNNAPVSISADINAGTINQLRLAFQIQKWYEKLALGGDRYIEIIKSMFGVTSPDARLQRSEYLGGNRLPIMIHEVMQTSGTATTPQGTSTGNSLTTDVHNDFNHSFTEHGFVIGLMVARYDHTYQQGLDRLWTRSDKMDFYWPVFANIGNQSVKNDRIYCQGSSVLNPDTGKAYDEEVFGYQEAWAEYRYKPSIVTGQMRSAYAQSLDTWHFADDYESMPYLSSEWLKEDKSNIDRTLAINSESGADQFFCDIYIENMSTRPMPMYSVPGLIDHH